MIKLILAWFGKKSKSSPIGKDRSSHRKDTTKYEDLCQ